jgi:hypothetical protein
MKRRVRRSNLWIVLMCISGILLTACSTSPRMDGGIVGTGNGVDCEAERTKGGTPESLPPECRPDSRK